MIPTAFCSGEAVGCCTQLTEEGSKYIRSVKCIRSVFFMLIFSAFLPRADLCSVSSGLVCILECVVQLLQAKREGSSWISMNYPSFPDAKGASKVLEEKGNNCLQGVAL